MDAKDWVEFYIDSYRRQLELIEKNKVAALEAGDDSTRRFNLGLQFAFETVISDLERFQARLQEV